MNYADQIAASVSAIRADLNECTERLELRDEYRTAFDLWAGAIADCKGWIADEARSMGCKPGIVLTYGHSGSPRWKELRKRALTLYALMEEARERCELLGDEDWAAEQESIEFDVENAEVTK